MESNNQNQQPDRSQDGRYPYTYAADLIRMISGPSLSRADAATIHGGCAAALGADSRALAEKLADTYLAFRDVSLCSFHWGQAFFNISERVKEGATFEDARKSICRDISTPGHPWRS